MKGPLGRIDDRLTLVFSPRESLDFWTGHRRGSWSSLTRSAESQELPPDQRPVPGRDVSVTRRHAGNGRASTVAPPEAVDLLLIKTGSGFGGQATVTRHQVGSRNPDTRFDRVTTLVQYGTVALMVMLLRGLTMPRPIPVPVRQTMFRLWKQGSGTRQIVAS